MGLPLPRVVPDVGPGGPLVTAMGGMNSLANANVLRQINQIKAQYMPATTQADIASKNAYARLVGLQPFGKIMGNEMAYANLPDATKQQINEAFLRAGGAGSLPFPEIKSNNNSLNQMPQQSEQSSGTGQPPTNKFSGWVKNMINAALGRNQNTMAQPMPQQQNMNPSQNSFNQQAPQQAAPSKAPPGGVSREGQQWYDKNGNPVYEQDVPQDAKQGMPPPSIEMEMTGGQRVPQKKTWADTLAAQKGTLAQGAEAGKLRAQAQSDIGKAQLGLSASGASLENLTKIIKDPIMQNMRNTIPGFQDKQIAWLKTFGTKAQKKMIGRFTGAAESMIENTVKGMGIKHLVREYDLATRQKINDSDTIPAAEGKLKNAIELHDIAEQKNDIIADLLGKGMSEAKAVKQANKMIDVSAIEKRTDALLADKITDADIAATAKKRGLSKEQVIARLKKEGRYGHG